jgi:hypothetical protein
MTSRSTENDSAINSAEQVHLMAVDLSRAEATKRVWMTQLEALKRQVTSIRLSDKQAREMVKTLKNQLIRRPVISVKSDQRPSTDQQALKRVHDLESELMEVKDELRRQTNINFQIAKNSTTRLEREKNMLENKVKSGWFLHIVSMAQKNGCALCHLRT